MDFCDGRDACENMACINCAAENDPRFGDFVTEREKKRMWEKRLGEMH